MINAEESFDLNLGLGDIPDHSMRPEFELAQATFALSKKPGHTVRDNHDLNEGLCAESSRRLSRDTPPCTPAQTRMGPDHSGPMRVISG